MRCSGKGECWVSLRIAIGVRFHGLFVPLGSRDISSNLGKDTRIWHQVISSILPASCPPMQARTVTTKDFAWT
jgi:hypothetical protein